MGDRFIDLSEEAAGLSVRNQQLVIRRDSGESSLPLEELAALVVSHPAVHYSHAVLAGIMANGGAVIVCDEKRLPVGLLLPTVGHSLQTETMAAQISASEPLRKNLWQQVIKAKLLAQARVLGRTVGHDAGLTYLSGKVRSGDPENLEAQGSRKYWPALFGDSFRRVPGSDEPVNRLLNYGYAILRGIVGRAVCSAGLHPSVGLHHHNRYDAYCLVNDLMEPLRPLVDELALTIVRDSDSPPPLDRLVKEKLVSGLLSRRFEIDGESRTLFDLSTKMAVSLTAVFRGERKKLTIPEL